MSLPGDIRTYLVGVAGLTALVGSRIYPVFASSAATFPYIVYSKITADHINHMTAAAGLSSHLYQFDIFDSSYDGADAVREQVRLAIDGRRGAMGASGVRWSGIANEREDHSDPQDGSDGGVHRISIDVNFWATESVPAFA